MWFWLLVMSFCYVHGTTTTIDDALQYNQLDVRKERRLTACGTNHTCDCHQTKKTFYLVDCSLRHLSVIPTLPHNATEINISRNMITGIPPETFQWTVNMTSIIFTRNRIIAIPSGLFSSLNNIENVDFSRNRIKEIPTGCLSSAFDIRTIDFAQNRISHFPFDLTENKTKLQTLDISRNFIEEIPMGCLSSALDIKTIDFSRNKISHIPSDLTENKTNLENLFFEDNYITNLDSGIFDGNPSLIKLHLRNNRLKEIAEGLLLNTTQIESVELSQNFITEIPKDLFANTPHLKHVDFQGNKLSEIPDGLFSNTPALKTVTISSNLIRQLPHRLFQGLQALKSLDLQDNELTNLQCDIFIELSNVKTIILSKNRIRTLCPTIFSSFKKVKEIRLDGNDITALPENLLWKTQALEIITLSRNCIRSLPESFLANVPNLQSVEIAHNAIRVVPEYFFERTTKLLSIIISANVIERLPRDLFAAATKLSTLLKISHNRLRSLHEDTFSRNHEVRSIDVSYNLLREIPAGLFSKNYNIKNIDLSGNRLETLPVTLLSNSTELKRLHLSDNLLTDIPPGFFKSTPNLYYLVLSNNKLQHVHHRFFNGLEKIPYLSLSGNNIHQLPANLFSNMTISYCIDLSNNSLTEIPLGLFNSSHTKHGALILLLQRNNLTRVRNGLLHGFSRLGHIFLNNNEISEVEENAFSDMPIENIYLFNNKITKFKNSSFTKTKLQSTLHLYKNRLEYISANALEDMPHNMKLLLSCGYLKSLPMPNRNIRSECVTNNFVPKLTFSRSGDVFYEVLRHQGFDCSLKRGTAICRPCPPGTFGNESGHCTPCPAGGFYQDDIGTNSCLRCHIGSFVKTGNGSSASQCILCPEGTKLSTFAGYRACPCKENYTRLHRFEKCSVCLEEGLNCSQDYKALLPGYYWNWTFPNANLMEYSNFVLNLQTENVHYHQSTVEYKQLIPRVFACSRPENCMNNNSHEVDGIAGSCTVGYRAWLCSKCVKGYYSVLGFCLPCPNIVWVCFEISMTVFIFIIFLVFVIVKSKKQNRSEERRTIADIVSSRVKIVLGFYQVVGELFEAFHSVSWAGVLQYIGEWITVLEFNILRLIVKPYCLHEKLSLDHKLQFKIALLFPLVVILTAFACQPIFRVYFKYRKRYDAHDLKLRLAEIRSGLSTYVLLIMFVTYPSTCEVIFSLYPCACDTFSIYKENDISITLLRADYDIVCSDLLYYQIFAFLATLLYVISFPVLLLLFLRKYTKRQRDNKHITEPDTNLLNSEDSLMSEPIALNCSESNEETHAIPVWLNFLCENFKPGFWFWEILELARKVTQTMLITLLGWDDPLTKLITIGVSVLFLTLHVKFSPMKNPFEQRLQLFSLAVIFVNVLFAAVPMSSDYGNYISIGIITLDAAIIVIVSGEAILPAYRYIKRRCQRNYIDYLSM
ncbi:uncharacterized protein [Apostichopus japonicus]|uniref:uncharacterized protein isoform X3 n=1 Tax=Stichopus japonicus TaxID=307972 RepID=UPI003AB17CDD